MHAGDSAGHVAPTAVVEEGATIGDGSRVWDQVVVRTRARIGAGCTIGRNVFIDAGVVVGERCKIQNNALIYAPATIGDGAFIGPGAIITNDRVPRAVNPDGTVKAGDDWEAPGVTVGEGASVGAAAVVVAGVTIGAWALVGAGAVVAADVAAHALVVGAPARRIGWVDRAGDRLVAEGDGRWRSPGSGDLFVESGGTLRTPT